MSKNLHNRSFLSLRDYSPDEIAFLLNLATDLKRAKATGTEVLRLSGKEIALIFEKDTARVLGRVYDAIEFRGYGQKIVAELAEWAGVPVYNGLTDAFHPTQILADLLTMGEHCDRPCHRSHSVSLAMSATTLATA